GAPPLLQAALLSQDDLLLMRKTESGWILAAGVLFFPSSWRLSEKFNRPMHDIHAPVPGFAEGTRNALLIERIFDNLKPSESLRRENWGLYADDNLVHEKKRAKHADRFDDPAFLMDPFVRSEIQTLTKLPRSGDILFTVHIDVARLSAVRSRPGGVEATAHLSRNLAAMEPEQLRYKGLDKARDELLLHLQPSR
ncbi:MAG: heme-dependent oxidative N-demethylase subunit alpha family protein, partial [Pseudomonadota bacterium]